MLADSEDAASAIRNMPVDCGSGPRFADFKAHAVLRRPVLLGDLAIAIARIGWLDVHVWQRHALLEGPLRQALSLVRQARGALQNGNTEEGSSLANKWHSVWLGVKWHLAFPHGHDQRVARELRDSPVPRSINGIASLLERAEALLLKLSELQEGRHSDAHSSS